MRMAALSLIVSLAVLVGSGSAHASECPYRLRESLDKLAQLQSAVSDLRGRIAPLNNSLGELRLATAAPESLGNCGDQLTSRLERLMRQVDGLGLSAISDSAQILRVCAQSFEMRIAADLRKAEAAQDVNQVLRLTKIRDGIIDLGSGSIRVAQDADSLAEKGVRMSAEIAELQTQCTGDPLSTY